MSESYQNWNLDELSPEARHTAERAAEAAGMPLDTWLNQLIKYVSAMELKGEAPDDANGLDRTIEALAAAHSAALDPGEPGDNQPGDLAANQEAGLPPVAEAPPPTALAPGFLSPSRFADELPGERDIEGAIDGWRRAGSLLPVVVRPDDREPGEGEERRYEIVSGAERWHAANRLKMKLVPVVVTDVSDDELLRATLIDRLRRRHLSPIEEARTYQRILAQSGQGVTGLATDIGCAPSLIADALKLIELPEPVQAMLEDGELTVLHARALLAAEDPESLAREVVARQLDIYQTEQLLRNLAVLARPQSQSGPDETARSTPPERQPGDGESARPEPLGEGDAPALAEEADADQSASGETASGEIARVEKNLANLLGVEVTIDDGGEDGVLSLRYATRKGLRDLVSRLNRAPDRG
ncbi:MAG: ParB/RepB/Spo0J family partition protein [Alphaproteobacteria bacterium]